VHGDPFFGGDPIIDFFMFMHSKVIGNDVQVLLWVFSVKFLEELQKIFMIVLLDGLCCNFSMMDCQCGYQ
jgi:hypothetical protein